MKKTEIDYIINTFEDQEKILAKKYWNHVGHVIVGLYYCLTKENPAKSLEEGIKKHNASHNSLGYNKTITYFRVELIQNFIDTETSRDLYILTNKILGTRLGKFEYIYQYYPKDQIFTDKYKKDYIPPKKKINIRDIDTL